MKVRDLPPGRLLSVDPQTLIAEVARQMQQDDSDSVAVISDGRLVGIVTERDLVRAIAEGMDPQQAKAETCHPGFTTPTSYDMELALA